MRFLIIAAVAMVVAVQAIPYEMGMGEDYGGGYDGGYGGGYGGGSQYGQNEYQGGRRGYQNSGYGTNLLHSGHNLGHVVNDYDATVHHHQAAAHDVGQTTSLNNRGHQNAGYNGYQGGQSGYGSNWNRGMGY